MTTVRWVVFLAMVAVLTSVVVGVCEAVAHIEARIALDFVAVFLAAASGYYLRR